MSNNYDENIKNIENKIIETVNNDDNINNIDDVSDNNDDINDNNNIKPVKKTKKPVKKPKKLSHKQQVINDYIDTCKKLDIEPISKRQLNRMRTELIKKEIAQLVPEYIDQITEEQANKQLEKINNDVNDIQITDNMAINALYNYHVIGLCTLEESPKLFGIDALNGLTKNICIDKEQQLKEHLKNLVEFYGPSIKTYCHPLVGYSALLISGVKDVISENIEKKKTPIQDYSNISQEQQQLEP